MYAAKGLPDFLNSTSASRTSCSCAQSAPSVRGSTTSVLMRESLAAWWIASTTARSVGGGVTNNGSITRTSLNGASIFRKSVAFDGTGGGVPAAKIRNSTPTPEIAKASTISRTTSSTPRREEEDNQSSSPQYIERLAIRKKAEGRRTPLFFGLFPSSFFLLPSSFFLISSLLPFRYQPNGSRGFTRAQDRHQVRQRQRRELTGKKVANLQHGQALRQEEVELRAHLLRHRRSGVAATATAAATAAACAATATARGRLPRSTGLSRCGPAPLACGRSG